MVGEAMQDVVDCSLFAEEPSFHFTCREALLSLVYLYTYIYVYIYIRIHIYACMYAYIHKHKNEHT